MNYNKYIKNDKIINATKKAFNVTYKNQDYKPYNEATNHDKNVDKADTNAIVYDEVTKPYIRKLLVDKGIEHNSRDSKQELYDLLLGSD